MSLVIVGMLWVPVLESNKGWKMKFRFRFTNSHERRLPPPISLPLYLSFCLPLFHERCCRSHLFKCGKMIIVMDAPDCNPCLGLLHTLHILFCALARPWGCPLSLRLNAIVPPVEVQWENEEERWRREHPARGLLGDRRGSRRDHVRG